MKVSFGKGRNKLRLFKPLVTEVIQNLLSDSDFKEHSIHVNFVELDDRELGNVTLEVAQSPKITLNLDVNGSPYLWCKALCHEITHVMQIASGRMEAISSSCIVFDGEFYIPAEHPREWMQTDAPWEVEAYAAQDLLYSKLKEGLTGKRVQLGALVVEYEDIL
ncbi:hypothetical protein VCHA53O466_50214 [Vibrio chagasii]|nr:hypothetical protein VCHA53O466_50214 [Vibrio chagasii]